MDAASNEKTKPVHTDRRGRMNLAIFANETEHGMRYSSEITRSRKVETDDEKAEYNSTHWLDEQDLLNSAKLANVADDWIGAKRRER